MGRRKIEIKQIKDDRNRSVTFLKRKGGLFKKAHELSVLCNVDVAVIIFGQNKKLYEYSSGDITEIIQRHQFYGGANEHKGPSDFNGKGGDDDEDEDENSIPEDGHSHGPSNEPPMMPQQFANQAAFQHMRQGPSASPPIGNSAQFAHVQRQLTPQPPMQMGSRPSSRNAPRMINSNMAQQHMQQPHPSPPVNGFTYMSQAPMYQGMPAHSQAPQQSSFQYTGPPPQQHQLQQVYMEEQRRASMPPAFPQHERQNSGSINTPPISHHQLPSQHHQQQAAQLQQQHQQQQAQMHHQAQQEQQRQQQAYQQQQQQQQAQMKQELPPPPQPQPQQQQAPQAQMLEPVKRMSVKSRSIFTPIDESRSILSQHWASSTTTSEATRPSEPQRSSSASSIATVTEASAASKAGAMKSPPKPKRNISIASTATVTSGPPSSTFGPPSRTNSGLGGASGGKRPRLKVQIPDEASENEAGTGSTNSPREGATAAETANTSQPQQPRTAGGMVLPPPSPIGLSNRDQDSILSAGATGPPNPFARPLPPQSNPSRESLGSRDGTMLPGSRDGDITPASALPSRYMMGGGGDYLPSPGNLFFGEGAWAGFRGGANELPSPLNFTTPVVGVGPSFLREDSAKDSAGGANRPGTADMGNGAAKRKSPENDEGTGGDEKRPKIEQ